MGAPKGNKYWELRSKHGRDKLFETPELLWEAATEYFQWTEDNPLFEHKAFAYQGDISVTTLPKMRAMTLSGLCLYLGCNEAYFRSFKAQKRINAKEFSTVIEQIEQIIYNQKFQGAAAELLNSNIIAMELGLKSHSDLTTNGKDIESNPVTFYLPDNGRDEKIVKTKAKK